jgi:two-component system phosphate regulon sensor histidine kinase PhoR
MKIKKNSFKYKLIFSYIFIILFSFSFVAYFLDKSLEENSLQEIKSSLINQTYLVESQISKTDLKNEDIHELETKVLALSSKMKSRLTIVNNIGKVLAESEKLEADVLKMPSHVDRPEIKAALAGGLGEEIRYSSTLKIDMLYIALPIWDNNQILGAVRLALPLASVQKTLASVRKAIFLSLFFALGLSFVLGSLLAQAIIKPINKIIHISRRFSNGDFSHKILLDSKNEIGELADTLNRMADSLEDKIKKVEIKNQQLKAILESMVEGIIVTDEFGHIISLNPTVKKIFNISEQNIEGKLFLEIIRNNDILDIVNHVLKKGKFKSCELSLVWPVQKIFEINATPIFGQDSVNGCLLVIHDITEIRRLETMRRDFVANVSHELKTPLTSIKGFVETLLEGALEDKENSRHFLQIIQGHTNRLDNLVNDLLDLSHLESQEIKVEKEKVNLKALTNDILASFRSQFKKRSIQASNDLSSDVFLTANKDKIGQVLSNLIDNAIKFNRENGFIKIYSQDQEDKIKIVVEDSGIGIPVKDIPRIFERFYRVDKARSRELGGTGLGLSIVKHIVELHGGRVGVESTEGLGAKFWFTLPK